MVSRYAKDPLCAECGKKKGPRQKAQMRCAACQRVARKTAAEKSHGSHVLATYGITAEEYKALWAFQGGKCAICIKASGKTRRLAVDHDHKCTAGHEHQKGCRLCVRGLLCGKCNGFLGYIRDDASFGGRIKSYLESPPWQRLRAQLMEAA